MYIHVRLHKCTQTHALYRTHTHRVRETSVSMKCVQLVRSLEYTIHEHELRQTCTKLEALQDKREKSGAQSHKLREEQQQAADQIKVGLLLRITSYCDIVCCGQWCNG